MRRLALALLPVFWLWAGAQAVAQQWLPGSQGSPIVCAYNGTPPTIATGLFIYAQCDTNGKLITSGGGGGGGGAVTLASGSVSAGAYVAGAIVSGGIADLYSSSQPVPYAGTGPASAITELDAIRLNALGAPNLVITGPGVAAWTGVTPGGTAAATINAGDVNLAAVGTKAVSVSGASVTEPPWFGGGIAETSNQTAVTAGQKVGQEMTLSGKAVVQPYALPGDLSANQGSQTGTSTITVLSASGSASLLEYMTGIRFGRSDTGTTAITVAVTDGTTTKTWVLPNSGGGSQVAFAFVSPLKWAANTAVTCAASSGVTTFYCDANGYNAP